jgi:glycosyltransferase involved in cell wall biosynthesis
VRVLFTSGSAYLPQQSGGVQSSTHQLAMRLMRQGIDVGVLCKLQGGGWTEIQARVKKRLTGKRFARDETMGYPVYRAWDPIGTSEVVERFKPDVAVVQSGQTVPMASSLEADGVPVVLYFRNVEFDELCGDPSSLHRTTHIANSQFTADRYQEAFGLRSTVIPPLIDVASYKTPTTRENVTFINPYPVKGVDHAIEIARRCPDVAFSFVESWSLNEAYKCELAGRLAQLRNVTLRPRTSDMKSVYGKARIVLAPSKWEEAWGRVASEAHCSGIPVIGSRRGGLPEAIGDGGIVIDYDAPIENWVEAVRRLWDDDKEYDRLSSAARAFSERPALDPENQFVTFLQVLGNARQVGLVRTA